MEGHSPSTVRAAQRIAEGNGACMLDTCSNENCVRTWQDAFHQVVGEQRPARYEIPASLREDRMPGRNAARFSQQARMGADYQQWLAETAPRRYTISVDELSDTVIAVDEDDWGGWTVPEDEGTY